MVLLDQLFSMDLISWFSGVICWGITLPLNFILQGLFMPEFAHPYNFFHFPLLFPID
jgi:hypothetical protein